jgi:hypothetical protein
VAYGARILVLDKDYVVTYGTNINVGTGIVIVEGIGNYQGAIKKEFRIITEPETEGQDGLENETSEPKKGTVYTYGKLCYNITGNNTVAFVKPVDKKIKKLAIPSKVQILGKSFKVTKIDKKACYNCKQLNTVTIGNSVTVVGDQAFAKCKKLSKVTIGKGLKKIGKKTFYEDGKLRTLVIKSSKLTSVGKGTLKGVKIVDIYTPKKKKEKYKMIFKRAKE